MFISKANCVLQCISIIHVSTRHRTTTTIINEIVTELKVHTPYEETLSKTPSNLFVLWQDNMFGVAGRKLARILSV